MRSKGAPASKSSTAKVSLNLWACPSSTPAILKSLLRLLHFRRTFVEKMFAIHGKVQLLKRDNTPLGTYARHYYAGQAEVIAMLKSAEYAAIKKDYDEISRTHFEKGYFYPEGMSFAQSGALFPSAELAKAIGDEYEAQCTLLCYGPHPSWEEIQAR